MEVKNIYSKQVELDRYFPRLRKESQASLNKPSFFEEKLKAESTSERNLNRKQASLNKPSFSEEKLKAESTSYRNLNRKQILEEIKSNPEKKKLYDASLEFQSLFIGQMLSSMRKNLNSKNDLLYGGFKQKIFEDMLYDEYASMLSKTDNFDIADEIYRQNSKNI